MTPKYKKNKNKFNFNSLLCPKKFFIYILFLEIINQIHKSKYLLKCINPKKLKFSKAHLLY